jgi:hypothetical protein
MGLDEGMGMGVAAGEAASRTRLGELFAEALPLALAARHGSAETGAENLAWMCRTACAGIRELPADKLARWLGFVHDSLGTGSFEAPEPIAHPPGPLLHAHRTLFGRYEGIAREAGLGDAAEACRIAARDAEAADPVELSYRLGRMQGSLVREGLVSVAEERDVSRPLFHAAYARTGTVPPTLSGPGARS